MKTAVIALTKGGSKTALHIGKVIDGDIFIKYPCPDSDNATVFSDKLSDLVKDIFPHYEAFVLIMATGIAFRTFAPYITAKDKDPALVVVDEKGSFAISLLSGHLGGANDLAKEIAEKIDATPVSTTSTDVNQTIAFDNVAKKNGFLIEDLSMTMYISGALVNGKKVSLLTPYPIIGTLPKEITDHHNEAQENVVFISNRLVPKIDGHVLVLRPKNLILGIGCRKNISYEAVKEAFDFFMKDTGYSPLSLKAMASVDLKKEEEALLLLSERENLPFYTYDSDTLNAIEAEGGTSSFVKSVTGTASVCQSAAVCCGKDSKTVIKKTVVNGITFSLAEEPTSICL